MTSTLDRPFASPEAQGDASDEGDGAGAPQSAGDGAGPRARPGSTVERTPALLVLAALSAAAGVVHLVMVPPHFDSSTADGVAFLAAGWVQVGLAVALVARPRRALIVAVALANAAFVGAWVMAHSVGLPYGAHRGTAESATFVSQVTLAVEVAAVVLAFLLVFQPRFGTAHRRASIVLAGIATVAVLALTTAAIASPSARGHDEGGSEAAGGGHGHAGGHHGEATGAPAENAKVVDDRGYAALGNGHEHELPEGYGEPLDSATELELQRQLAHAYQLQAEYPTVADAEAAGYQRSGPFAPGLGAHYGYGTGASIVSGDGPEGAPEVGPPMLIYDGIEPDSPIAGFMYIAHSLTEEPTEGFAGVDDVWHYHSDVCIVMGPDGIDAPLGADRSATEAECDALGGSLIEKTNYMVHVWSVPGYESRDGLFSNLNPALQCPDGTYEQVPSDEIGLADSTCLRS